MKDITKASKATEVNIDICLFLIYKVLDRLDLKKLVVLVPVN